MAMTIGRHLRLIALLSLALVVLASCGKSEKKTAGGASASTAKPKSDRGNVDGQLTIGELLPSTGDLAQLGPPMVKATELAVKQINDAGGVNGKPVKLVPGDDGTNPDVANATVDRELAADKVDAIVGAASSKVSKAVIDKITGAGVVQCSPSNTSAEFTTINSNGGYYFRTAPPDNLQGPVLADLITGDGKTKVAIVALNDAYGQGLGKAVKDQLRKNGADVVADVAYDPNGTSFDSDVKKVVDAKPDAIALLAFPDTGGRILASLANQGFGPDKVQVYVADGMQSKTLYQKVNNNPASTAGIKGTAPSSAPTNGVPGFAEAFKAYAPGVDTIFSAHAYDCATVIALAAQSAKTDDPTKFRQAMFDVTKDGTKCTSFQQCKALLDQGVNIDYDGASGPIDFVKTPAGGGEPTVGQYEIYTFKPDGTYATDPKQVVSKT